MRPPPAKDRHLPVLEFQICQQMTIAFLDLNFGIPKK